MATPLLPCLMIGRCRGTIRRAGEFDAKCGNEAIQWIRASVRETANLSVDFPLEESSSRHSRHEIVQDLHSTVDLDSLIHTRGWDHLQPKFFDGTSVSTMMSHRRTSVDVMDVRVGVGARLGIAGIPGCPDLQIHGSTYTSQMTHVHTGNPRPTTFPPRQTVRQGIEVVDRRPLVGTRQAMAGWLPMDAESLMLSPAPPFIYSVRPIHRKKWRSLFNTGWNLEETREVQTWAKSGFTLYTR
ncbi:hypothetical protein F5146DRAFT_1005507 [Armillaria mellea]|nr:hypothetical protein F5146DRAFT_1005507 [Armillaria mellea]